MTILHPIHRPQIRLLLALAGLIATIGTATAADPGRSKPPAETAREILDDARPAEERQKLAADAAAISHDLIRAMAAGLENQPDLKEEYRRIPWIWRVAVAGGKRNQDDEIRRLLKTSLPEDGSELRDWQAVVVGGGLINGIGLVGGWPSERIAEIIGDDDGLQRRWIRIQDQASAMTDDEAVHKGTRYDAIRILGVGTWDRRGAQIFRYLLKGVDDELQMGAVSALGDMQAPTVGQALLSGFGHYSETNRDMALDALIRDDSRIGALLDAVESGRIAKSAVGAKRVETLRKTADPQLQKRVRTLFDVH